MEKNDIEKTLVEGNKSYIEKIKSNKEKHILAKNLVGGQHPFALIITCSDSRVIPEEIFDKSLGDLFVIRTAGNVINEGELASIEYGIEHLHIKYVLILGHTHCGAVHAAMHHEKGKYLGAILDSISNNICNSKSEDEAAICNAKAQAEFIKSKFPSYTGLIKYGLYDIETNEVKIH